MEPEYDDMNDDGCVNFDLEEDFLQFLNEARNGKTGAIWSVLSQKAETLSNKGKKTKKSWRRALFSWLRVEKKGKDETVPAGNKNNSGFFYIRPTFPSIELLDRVADRLAQENAWDQAVFNEEQFFPSHPGYDGLYAGRRTMDMYLFMNSKVLFKTVRKDANLSKLKPVIVHVNYHPDKLPRMKAVVEFYCNGKKDALQPFPDGSQ